MKRFRVKPAMVLAAVLALLVLAFSGTFFIAGNADRATGAEGVTGSAAAPAVSGVSAVAVSVRDFFLKLFGARDVDREYEALKARVQQLEVANQLMQDLQLENERLMKLFNFKEQYPNYEYIPARVIGRESDSWFFYFMLNRGTNDGVEKNMPVVNESGMVGTIIEAGPTWCKVMAIIDRMSAISVVVELSRDQGMAHGSGDPQGSDPACTIEHLTSQAEVVPGDKVVTSDFDGYTIKGIPVGTISEVSRGQEKVATLIPYVDFAHLENVLIIRKEKKAGDSGAGTQQSASPAGTATAETPGGTETSPAASSPQPTDSQSGDQARDSVAG